MDRDAPAALMDTAQRGYDESKALIERWRGRGRLDYAITPRFAVTSTQAQLDAAGALAREFPDCYVQTHANENKAEIARVAALFPEARSYIDVYARAGLLGPRSVIGHCIHLQDSEVAALAESGSVAAFCPTSNLFLGSGLFDQARLTRAGVRIALATDVGGGTSYSMLRTAAEGYKVLQLNGQSWPALEAFYRMTLGNARALSLDDRIGSIEAGKEADLIALDPRATPALAHRMETAGGRSRGRAVRPPHARRRSGGAPDLCRGRAAEGKGRLRSPAAGAAHADNAAASEPCSSSEGYRTIVRAPAVHALGKVPHVLAADRPRPAQRIARPSARLTDENDRLSFRQLLGIEGRHRHVESVWNMAGGEFVRLANVHHCPGVAFQSPLPNRRNRRCPDQSRRQSVKTCFRT